MNKEIVVHIYNGIFGSVQSLSCVVLLQPHGLFFNDAILFFFYDKILFLLQKEYAGMAKGLEDRDQNWAVTGLIFGRWE